MTGLPAIIDDVKEAYRFRALPLAISTILLVLILLPDFLKILLHAVNTFLDEGWPAIKDYSAVNTLFAVMVLICIAFAIHLVKLTARVQAHYRELNKLAE